MRTLEDYAGLRGNEARPPIREITAGFGIVERPALAEPAAGPATIAASALSDLAGSIKPAAQTKKAAGPAAMLPGANGPSYSPFANA